MNPFHRTATPTIENIKDYIFNNLYRLIAPTISTCGALFVIISIVRINLVDDRIDNIGKGLSAVAAKFDKAQSMADELSSNYKSYIQSKYPIQSKIPVVIISSKDSEKVAVDTAKFYLMPPDKIDSFPKIDSVKLNQLRQLAASILKDNNKGKSVKTVEEFFTYLAAATSGKELLSVKWKRVDTEDKSPQIVWIESDKGVFYKFKLSDIDKNSLSDRNSTNELREEIASLKKENEQQKKENEQQKEKIREYQRIIRDNR